MATKPNLRVVPSRDVGLIDALNNQINVAEGIQLAIMGEGHLVGDAYTSPLCALCDVHIAALRQIVERVS